MNNTFSPADVPKVPEEGIVGHSRELRAILARVDEGAPLSAPALITGESGTGKELVARALHYRGPRKRHAFVPIDCRAVPESVQEVELFGHVKGAYTGALRDRMGLIEEADGGTVFFDEVTALGSSVQARLSQFLEDGTFRRVGAPATIAIDARVVAATGCDVEGAIRDGRLREDLARKLGSISIHVPPLRERPDDIELLAHHLIEKTALAQGMRTPAISDRALHLLKKHEWQGNIRELGSILTRALTFDRDGVITSEDLPPGLRERKEDRLIAEAQRRRLTLDQLEREYILATLEECGGRRKETATRLGVTPVTLWRKLKRCRVAG